MTNKSDDLKELLTEMTPFEIGLYMGVSIECMSRNFDGAEYASFVRGLEATMSFDVHGQLKGG